MWYWPPGNTKPPSPPFTGEHYQQLEPGHCRDTLARVEPEADDAGYVKISQPELPSDQVLTEAGAGTRVIQPKQDAPTNLTQ